MDRFTWHSAGTSVNEEIKVQAPGVCLYDGEERTVYEVGAASLTPHRLIWADFGDPNCRLSLHHSLVLGLEKTGKSWLKSGKILLHLAPVPPGSQGPGPKATSNFSYVRLSFRQGHDDDFCKAYREVLEAKSWAKASNPSTPSSHSGGRVTPRAGIVGIERRMADQHSRTAHHISAAFEDLSNLMDAAKEMVAASKAISEKLRSKQGSISEDETVEFKSYLLSLGLEEPVTKESSGGAFHEELSRELAEVLRGPLKEAGGILSLAEAYCRVNRARGLELVSPQDVWKAALLVERSSGGLRLLRLSSGVSALGLAESGGVEDWATETAAAVGSQGLQAFQLAKSAGIPVLIASERLLAAETAGLLCRDDSPQGLIFFPNRLLQDHS